MPTIIYLTETCDAPYFMQTSPDDAMLLTAMGRKRADSLVASAAASRQVGGEDANGDVLYTARFGGVCGNHLRVQHIIGDTGVGHEDRALQVDMLDHDLTVQFGTDGSGLSVVPSAQEVADAINANPATSAAVSAAAQGTGAGLVSATAYAEFSGGLDDGDMLKFPGNPPTLRHVARVEVA